MPKSKKTPFRLLNSLLSCPSYRVFVIGFLIGGIGLCLGSIALNIGELMSTAGTPYSCDSGPCDAREVGYLWAPNWSLTYAILGPIALFLMVDALKGIRAALDGLFASEMVRGEKMAVIRRPLSTQAWIAGTPFRSLLLFVCAGIVPSLIAYPEWYGHNWERLRLHICNGCNASDYDWGLAAYMPKTQNLLSWQANGLFDFATFTCEALLLAAAILTFLYMVDVTEVLPVFRGRVNGHLLPDLRSADPRRGFQRFEEPLQYMLTAGLTFYLVCYSIRINRIYMRSHGYANIIEFIKQELTGSSSGFAGFVKNQFSGALFDVPAPGRQDFLADTALILISFFSLFVVIRTVGTAARRAKSTAAFYYERPDAQSLFGLPIEEERKRVESMRTWPLEWKYFQLNWLITEVLVVIATLWFYRLGLYFCAVIVLAMLKRVKTAVDSWSKEGKDGKEEKKEETSE